jgi:hypothetical protein
VGDKPADRRFSSAFACLSLFSSLLRSQVASARLKRSSSSASILNTILSHLPPDRARPAHEFAPCPGPTPFRPLRQSRPQCTHSTSNGFVYTIFSSSSRPSG